MKETLEMADWLKIPSEVALGDKRSPKKILEDEGAIDTPLYRQLKEREKIEKKLRKASNA